MSLALSAAWQPLVSVVIPVYNMEKYLRECLDSVLGQTLADIEIICVNDGSTDSSPAILEEYAARDHRVRIINKPNGGVSSARNAAYSHLKGKYTYFADADDRLDPTLCSKTYYAAEHIQADVCFLFVRMDDGYGIDSIDAPLTMSEPTKGERDFLLSRINGGPWTKLFLTRFLLDNSLEFPPYRIGEDQLVHWQACLLAKRVAICPEQLYWYRQNPSSAMNSGGEKCLDVIGVFEMIKVFLVNHGLYERHKDTFLAMKLDHLYLECHSLQPSLHDLRQERLQATLCDDEIAWLTSDKAPFFFRLFFFSLLGNRVAAFRYRIYNIRRIFEKVLGFDRLKENIREKLVRRYSLTKRDDMLCEAVAILRRELVQGNDGK